MKVEDYLRLHHFFEDEEEITDDEKKEDDKEGEIKSETPSSVNDLKKKPLSVNSPLKLSSPYDPSKTSVEQLKKQKEPLNNNRTQKPLSSNKVSTPTISPTEVKSMIRREIIDYENTHKKREPTSSPTPQNSLSKPKKGSKKKSNKTSKSVRSKTNPTTQQSVPKPLIFGSFDQLEVVNINKELVYRLPYFTSQKITDYSTQRECNYGIISVCDGSRDVNTNMNYTLSLISDFIYYDFTYIPIYLKTQSNEIEDILFVVFQFRGSESEETKLRTFYDLQKFLQFCSQKYSVREHFIKQNNQFFSITSKGNVPMKEKSLRDVLITSLNHRKITIKDNSYFYFNPSPSNIVDKYGRMYSRNEICI